MLQYYFIIFQIGNVKENFIHHESVVQTSIFTIGEVALGLTPQTILNFHNVYISSLLLREYSSPIIENSQELSLSLSLSRTHSHRDRWKVNLVMVFPYPHLSCLIRSKTSQKQRQMVIKLVPAPRPSLRPVSMGSMLQVSCFFYYYYIQ